MGLALVQSPLFFVFIWYFTCEVVPLRVEFLFFLLYGMKKCILDLVVKSISQPRPGYVVLQLTDPTGSLPEMRPGQFVEVRVDGSPSTFLRRPISINFVDREANELWLLVHVVGAGTRTLARLEAGAVVNVVLPLGRGFSLPEKATSRKNREAQDGNSGARDGGRYLLVGGGVGTAPLLYLGQELVARGGRPSFLLGGRTADDLMQLDLFRRFGDVYLTTEDGSAGERGFVTQHSLWNSVAVSEDISEGTALPAFDLICTCGPKPMMMAVARLAREKGIPCEASLENLMACGLGACLCCVEDTTDGNVCVCKEGPVFSTDKLKW